jgi:hypothetical protein
VIKFLEIFSYISICQEEQVGSVTVVIKIRDGCLVFPRADLVVAADRKLLLCQESNTRMLYKNYDRNSSIEKKNSGRESQGARRQDEFICVNR